MKKNALQARAEILKRISDKKLVLFFDYDGTLTPIADRPELAQLSEDMEKCLKQLAHQYPTAIISGRSLANLREKVTIGELFYAGNHGLEITGPDHLEINYEMGHEFLDAIEEAYQYLEEKLAEVKGVLIEHKKFSLSVHYRLVAQENIPLIESAVNNILQKMPNLNQHFGKKVFELRPNLAWDKGKAVLWLLDTLKLKNHIMPIYIGDDITDEDAFKAIHDQGIGILVTEEPITTAADYYLQNTTEVRDFLQWIIGL